MQVIKRDGRAAAFDLSKIQRLSNFACEGLNASPRALEELIAEKFFDGMRTKDIFESQVISAASLISREKPDYTYAAARLVLVGVYKEVTGGEVIYPHVRSYLERALGEGLLHPLMAHYLKPELIDRLNALIDPQRDYRYNYLGMQTLADRYLLREAIKPGQAPAIIEMPQHFLLRVAMGLALAAVVQRVPDDRLIEIVAEYYDVFSLHNGMSSTPTLFNSGLKRPQMSSCYLNTVADTLLNDPDTNEFASIMGTITECASLSKWAGGIGTDWTRVRGENDIIKGTNGISGGIVPYLKVYNDVAVAVNQGGKRKGSFAPYLESWHPDFMKFAELKKNTGDERLRAHDIFPVSWLSDEFMRRVEKNDASVMWSFFSPHQYPELHELYGDAFTARYTELEAAGKFMHQAPVLEVWRKIISMLWETGHPWVTFKDTANLRNPQSHVGVIHNSNLCTEITLNTSDDETAVCNLASTNLANHVTAGQVDYEMLRRTVRTQVRMLDSVIDLNFYPSERARTSNLKHRPIGLGVMGLADLHAQLGIEMDSPATLDLQDELFEAWSYFAIEASSDLAAELGSYPTFKGSKWDQGILPIDTAVDKTTSGKFDWDALRAKIRKQGMRNSNVMAIAPTATISNIVGVTPSIEAPYELEYTKSNLSGTFTVLAPALRYVDTVKTAFEIDADWTILAAAVRQKWIDQAQSVNIFVPADTKGKKLSDLYLLAWRKGLKTTYYLRKLTVTTEQMVSKLKEPAPADAAEEKVAFCDISNPDCESCQ